MNKDLYISKFKDKKITLMGLGVLGRGLQVTSFLADCGAHLTVTDLKNKTELETSLRALKKYKNIRYVLGKHEMKDFEGVDLVIKAAGVPLDSPYIAHARAHDIPVAMDASLFARIIRNTQPSITIIGITGTRGKSMTTALIYHILKTNEKKLGVHVHLGGNMRMKATLPLLSKVSSGDFVVLELDSWQCQGFGDEKISPHIAVFTNLMPDHMNYYKNNMTTYFKDKLNIVKFQKQNDVLVTNKSICALLPQKIQSKTYTPNTAIVSKISMHIFGQHNIRNASYAYKVAKECGLSDTSIQQALESFTGLEGRLQYLNNASGIHIINDNNSTTPEATIAGIIAVCNKYPGQKINLIAGGSDKGLNVATLSKIIRKYITRSILLPGTGTNIVKKYLCDNYIEVNNLKSALAYARTHTKKGDLLLFSPGFASFGLFKNEYDRNDQFIRIIKKWK